MSTIHLAILAAMEAALKAAPAVTAGPITKGRSRPISSDHPQALNLNLVSSAVAIGLTGGRTGWMTAIDVECYGRASGDTSPQDAVDPLLGATYDRLLADNTLGGIAQDVNPAEGETIRWEFDDDGADKRCRATARFMVLHVNGDRTLSALPLT